MGNKGNKKLVAFIIAVVTFLILAVSLGTYFFFFRKSDVIPTQIDNSKNPVSTSGMRQYHNIERGFTLDYPPDLSIKDYDEGETTHTLIFADATGEKSFQLFFTPYLGDAITQRRIDMDIPDGKMIDPVPVVVGGSVHAIVFWSNSTLGRLREVWFIHDGYLFQATTQEQNDKWLSEILDSWKFARISPAGGS